MDQVRIVAVLDDVTNCEALYVDGKLHEYNHTIYMWDLARVAEGKLIEFSHMCVELSQNGEWPKRLKGLMQRRVDLTVE